MGSEQFNKTYNPHAIEERIYKQWESGDYFAPTNNGSAYCIAIPPPNVTGSLHMGHAFQDTLMDALIRYHRMLGNNTLWQAGTDHAGIATQMVVERMLEAEGKTRHDLGRDAFIDRVWQWKEQSGGRITQQLRRMGASLDWTRERFTMDEGLSHAVAEVFVRLYDEGLIYRGKRLVNWDPILHTAISDLEVISEEEDGFLWSIRYPLVDGSGHVVVATTRPETMLGDTAVAIHPDDECYRKLIGKKVELPLTGRQIPIIADTYVDPEFGSGCVKITPGHDFNDYEVGQRHGLEIINIFSDDAHICLPGSNYHGLDRYDARQRIVDDLTAAGLLESTEKHKLMVPRGDRTGSVIEPYLTDQWYVKTGPLAEPAIAAVESNAIRFVPSNWAKTYFEWMRNIQDWCISRQLWWGHRIPAWYDDAGNIYVAHDEPAVRQKYSLGADIKLRQDPDVLDTWFSSALWPFSTLGWPENTPALKTFYPTSVLVTGFDIIFFWVARMIMFGLKFTGEVPFREVYIHGLVRDADGQKMSKSKGNILDPLDLIDGIELEPLVEKRTVGLMQPQLASKIEKATRRQFPDGIPAYGTDALRFTFASLATQGRDIRFDTGRIQGYRNFCNKLWNASRYVLMNVEDQDCGLDNHEVTLTDADSWIISRLQQVEAEVDTAMNEYRFDLMGNTVYAFVWDEYCSWYLELAKVTLTNPTSPQSLQRGTRRTLVRVLEAILCLLHPTMPFITEEIWQIVAPLAGKKGDTIMLQPYPQAQPEKIDQAALEEMRWVMAVISGVRNIRGEMDIPPSKPLPVLLQNGNDSDRKRLQRNKHYLIALANMGSIAWLDDGEDAPESATSLVGRMRVLVPRGSIIDKEAELQRRRRERAKVEENLNRACAKLDNPSFLERAPEQIVAQERQRVIEFEAALKDIDEQLARLRRD